MLVKSTFKQAILTAGPSDDNLSASSFAGNAILIGGGGHDTLTGGSGWNILIGGSRQSTLTSGKNDDLLIGGTRAFDNNVAALNAIMREWSSTTPFTTRVTHLLGTKTRGKNSTVLLLPTGPSATVFNNGLADPLTGGLGLDRFFNGANGTAIDRNKGGKETVTPPP